MMQLARLSLQHDAMTNRPSASADTDLAHHGLAEGYLALTAHGSQSQLAWQEALKAAKMSVALITYLRQTEHVICLGLFFSCPTFTM